MTEQKFVDRPLSKSYFEYCILFVIDFVYSVFIYNTVTQGEISACFRSYFSGNKMKRGGGMIQNESQFNCIRKIDNSKKKKNIHKAEQTLTIRVIQSACKHTSSSFCVHVSCKQV